MKLEDISYAARAVGEVARASERLFDSLAASRRFGVWPVLLGVGVGVAIGAIVFNDAARNRVKAWLSGPAVTRVETKPTAGPRAQTATAPSWKGVSSREAHCS